MKVSSPAFPNFGTLPQKYTCEGTGINPPLLIEDVPLQAKSLVLIVDDPDAPVETYLHWLVYNIPPDTTRIEENSQPGVQGINTSGEKDFVPACPPQGVHRYFFKIYALDIKLDDDKNIEKKMKGHILATAEWIGLYKKATHGESQ